MIVDLIFAVRPIGTSDIDWECVEYQQHADEHYGEVDLVKMARFYVSSFAAVGLETHPEIGVTVRPDEG